MTKILVRAYTNLGYEEVDGTIDSFRKRYLVPWAMHRDGRVVYAEPTSSTPPNTDYLIPYDTQVSQDRRNLCHSELGVIALDKQFSHNALKKVSQGVYNFLEKKSASGENISFVEKFSKCVGQFLYGLSGYNSFGRFVDTDAPFDKREILKESIQAMINPATTLETLVNIHDGVGRSMIDPTDSHLYNKYMTWNKGIRPDNEGELIHRDWRGQKKIKTPDPITKYPNIPPSTLPGNVPSILKSGFSLVRFNQRLSRFPKLQSRHRGTDLYNRIAPKPVPKGIIIRPEVSGNIYWNQLDLRNELFGASPSGTTGTALAAAFTFGDFNQHGELFKEYLFAVIGYLIGGGMHSLHEVLSIVRLLGLEYNTGTLLGYDFEKSPAPTDSKGLVRGIASNNHFPLLPKTFLDSKYFEDWRDEYYDITILGGIHWRYNKFG